jgi:ketosteroid isomerase-like protein
MMTPLFRRDVRSAARRIAMRNTLLLIVGVGIPFAANAAADTKSPSDPVIAEVKARDDELAAAHGRGDMATYVRGLSSRYVYIDIGGRKVTAETLATRRANDNRRVVSTETSEDEAIRVSDDVVLLRGLERTTSTYFGGLPRQGSSRWTALWVRESDGVWRLVSETATPLTTDRGLAFTRALQPTATLRALEGRWALALPSPMTLIVKAEGDNLVGTLEGQSVKFNFVPASATHFFTLERPFALRFSKDKSQLELETWGIVTKGSREGRALGK